MKSWCFLKLFSDVDSECDFVNNIAPPGTAFWVQSQDFLLFKYRYLA